MPSSRRAPGSATVGVIAPSMSPVPARRAQIDGDLGLVRGMRFADARRRYRHVL